MQFNESPPENDVALFESLAETRENLLTEIRKVIVGQEAVVDQMLTALFAQGHCLFIGVPGLAKTLLVSTTAQALGLSFNRIQFTPDLMPTDITGTEVLEEDKATGERSLRFIEGPVFTNLLLADEINRTPPKTQAALLQAMQEREVSVAGQSRPLGRPFQVFATQNPIEQEGTYALPEAQLDRFLLHVLVDYPDRQAEADILRLVRDENAGTEATSNKPAPTLMTQTQIHQARQELLALHMAEPVERYIVELILATRTPPSELAPLIELGASPRGTIGLDLCARAHAWLMQRDFVTPDDVQAVTGDVLRHRLICSFEADAQGLNSNFLVDQLLQQVPVP